MRLTVIIDKRLVSVDGVSSVTTRMATHGPNPRFGILDVYGKTDKGNEVMIASFSEVSSWWVEK